MSITYGQAKASDLQAILELQSKNHKSVVDDATKQSQGFVTAQHDFKLLEAMNQQVSHTVAYDKGKLIGYALSMTIDFRNEIPILIPMFDMIDKCLVEQRLSNSYIVMGQICITEAYRGRGIFYGLYDAMKSFLADRYDYIITEVSLHNKRSLKAHYNQGFKSLKKYKDKYGEEWDLIIWDIKN